MPKYKTGLNCPNCGQATMTKMQMIQDLLVWTGQKPKPKFSNAEFTSEQLFHVWSYVNDIRNKRKL